ncbi:MAG: hypothetical protein ACRCY3_11460 [Sphingorhabdus sp.]
MNTDYRCQFGGNVDDLTMRTKFFVNFVNWEAFEIDLQHRAFGLQQSHCFARSRQLVKIVLGRRRDGAQQRWIAFVRHSFPLLIKIQRMPEFSAFELSLSVNQNATLVAT